MDADIWGVIGRIINILGCFFGLWLLAQSAREQWNNWNLKTQSHWWALVGWVFLGLELSIEMLILDINPGPRTVIQTLVIAWTIRALTMQEKLEADAPRMPWKGQSDDTQ